MSLKTYIETRKPPGGNKASVEKLESSAAPQSPSPNGNAGGADKKPATTEAAAPSHANKAGG